MARRKVCARKDQARKSPPVPPYMVPPMNPQVVSPIIVEGVASIIHARMGDVLDEVARRDIRCKPSLHNVHRSSLLSMCLVSKGWAETCQRIMRRRIVIPSVAAMKSFLRCSHQGKYVLELVYLHTTDDLYNYETPRGRSHWLLLADLLACMPNLHFLCVDIRDFPEENDDEDALAESDQDGNDDGEEGEGDSASDSNMESVGDDEDAKDSEPKGLLSASKDSTSEKVEQVEPQESEEVLEEDKQRGMDIEVDFTGIRTALRAIGRLVNLTGLVMLADFVVDISGSHKIMRFCPYFINICEQLPRLTKLTYLRIRGFSSDHQEEGVESFTGGNLITSHSPFPPILFGISPPSSLKTLIVELPSERVPYNAVVWLLKPQGTYTLQNLLLKFVDEDMFEALLVLSRKFDTPMPNLLNFRFEIFDDGSLFTGLPTMDRIRVTIATSFLNNMPSLQSLHIPPALSATLPDSLQELVFLYDYTEGDPEMSDFGDFEDERPDWFKRDMALVSALRDLSLPANVKEITIAVTNEEGLGVSPGTDDMEFWLPMTETHCEEEHIDVKLVEDRLLEDRMADFLLQGCVKYSSVTDYKSRRDYDW